MGNLKRVKSDDDVLAQKIAAAAAASAARQAKPRGPISRVKKWVEDEVDYIVRGQLHSIPQSTKIVE
jgi:hypothetical protein